MTTLRNPSRSPDSRPVPGRIQPRADARSPEKGEAVDRAAPAARSTALRAGAAGIAAVLAAALAGCARPAAATGPQIVLVNAYVGQPQGSSPTDAYIAIRNNGPADRLIAARTSVGGSVTMRGPVGNGTVFMRSYRDIPIAGHSLVRLIPNGYHLVISGAQPMKAGRDITITLVFAHGGALRIPANVTNPQTGGGSYFLN